MSTPRVIHQEAVNVYVDLNSPNKSGGADDFPDAAELARRYGVEEDSEDEGDREAAEEVRRKEIAAKEAEADSRRAAPELLSKMKQLTGKLTEKNREINRLCGVLERMHPIPGIDPEKFLQLYSEQEAKGKDEGGVVDVGVDYKDVKIVTLARKVRKVAALLAKEKNNAFTYRQQIDDLRGQAEKLTKELEALASPAARAAALRNMRADARVAGSEHDAAELKRELTSASKALDEAKRRAAAAETENRNLLRALLKEVGDGPQGQGGEDGTPTKLLASLEGESGGWRARAQQILALKNKIRKAEADNAAMVATLKQNQGMAGLASVSESGEIGGTSDDVSALTNAMRSYAGADAGAGAGVTLGGLSMGTGAGGRGVDSKAADVLTTMSSDRQAAIESVITDRERLLSENEAIAKKAAALKSRIRNLESEQGKHKEQMKVLLDKTDSDDQLVELLKAEIARLKEQLRQVSEALKAKKAENDSFVTSRIQHVAAGAGSKQGAGQKVRMVSNTDALEQELTRVKRLADQQSARLDTQDEVIRNLRTNGPGGGGGRGGKAHF